MGSLEILTPGLLTTVQDLGRPGFQHWGISPSGAADSFSFRLGNRLVGNGPNRAALEMTLVGASIRFESDAIIALTGADFGFALDGRPIKLWMSHPVKAGQILSTGHVRSGCRSYLCIQNGIEVPLVFGSASTHLQSGLGGYQGRGLKKGDRIFFRDDGLSDPKLEIQANVSRSLIRKTILRVTESIHTDLFSPANMRNFLNHKYLVTQHSNRLGLRLEGQALSKVPGVLTTGVCLGSIQISTSGQPVILFVEQQLTGGYPQIACVALADHPAIGQLLPGDHVSFRKVSRQEAIDSFYAQEQILTSNLSYKKCAEYK